MSTDKPSGTPGDEEPSDAGDEERDSDSDDDRDTEENPLPPRHDTDDDAPSGMPTHLREVPDYYKEALAYREAFRRLGFPSEQIFILVQQLRDTAGFVSIGMELRHPGPPFLKKFLCDVAIVRDNPEHLEVLWRRAVILWSNNATSNEERDEVWNRSHVKKNLLLLRHALIAKGIPIPAQET